MTQTNDKKIHILHVTETLFPFGGTPAKLLYQVLNSSPRFKFTICCVVSEGELAGKFREAGVEVIVLNRKKNYDVFQINDIVSIIKSRKVDIVHTHFARSNTFGRIAAILSAKRIIVSEHGILRNTSFPVFIFDNILNNFTAHHASNSYATMSSVQKKIFLNKRNMSVVHNGVPDVFTDYLVIPKEVLKAEFGFNPDDFIILNIGSHIPLRDHCTLIEAVNQIRHSIPRVKVVQIGDGIEHGLMEETIRRHELQNIFFLWGNLDREKVHRFICATDLYVNAAILEAFGIATVEAMLCERPVICANSGSLPELIDHEQEGLLFEPKNVDELSERILSLYRSKELRESLGKAARKRALEQFNIKQFVDAFEEKYLSMIQ